MKAKFILSFLVINCISLSVIGQNYNRPPNLPNYDYKKWHFGFTLGPEFQNFRIVNNSKNVIGQPEFTTPDPINGTVEKAYYYSDLTTLTPGFHVGIVTSRRLGEYFNLRIIPSLSLGQKDLKSNLYIEESVPGQAEYEVSPIEESTITTNIRSTYISLPVLIKYKAARIENARPFLVAGANFKYDLATDFEEAVTLKKGDISIELGMGSDFYMQTFRFGIELRFGIGLLNILETERPIDDPTPYLTYSMDKITAKTFTIAINFE